MWPGESYRTLLRSCVTTCNRRRDSSDIPAGCGSGMIFSHPTPDPDPTFKEVLAPTPDLNPTLDPDPVSESATLISVRCKLALYS